MKLEEHREKTNGLLMAASLERDGLLAEVQEEKVKLGELAAAHTSLAKPKNEIEKEKEVLGAGSEDVDVADNSRHKGGANNPILHDFKL